MVVVVVVVDVVDVKVVADHNFHFLVDVVVVVEV